MIPSTGITKTDGNTGVVRPSADGICAIVAPSPSGTANQAASYADPSNLLTERGFGALSGWGAYFLNVVKKPIVVVTPTCSTAASYGDVTVTGAGSSTITAGATAPTDDFLAAVKFLNPGTIGVTGITYIYTLDNWISQSGVKALGTANTLTIPNSGVSFALGAGTILAGELASCPVTGPEMTSSDLSTALEALRVTSLPFESVLVHGPSTAAYATIADAWLAGLEARGKFCSGILNTRFRSSGESDATFLAAMATAWGTAVSERLVVCADGGDMVSLIPGSGVTQARHAALAVAARGMSEDISRDAAYVADGPLPGIQIYDSRGVAKYHDEALNPGIDDLRLTALRSIEGYPGTYINNPNLLSSPGSDFVYWQHTRVMNKACSIAFQILTKQLSLGVATKPNPIDKTVSNITESDAQHLDALVMDALDKEMKNRVSAFSFRVSRTDNLSSNGPALVTSSMALSALRYIKTFQVKAGFVTAL